MAGLHQTLSRLQMVCPLGGIRRTKIIGFRALEIMMWHHLPVRDQYQPPRTNPLRHLVDPALVLGSSIRWVPGAMLSPKALTISLTTYSPLPPRERLLRLSHPSWPTVPFLLA